MRARTPSSTLKPGGSGATSTATIPARGRGIRCGFSIPKGGYLVHFDQTAQAAAPPPGAAPSEAPAPGDKRTPWRAIAAGLAVALAALSWWGLARPAGTERLDSAGPALVVLRFDPLGLGQDDRVLAEGVSQQLVSELMRFSALRIDLGAGE